MKITEYYEYYRFNTKSLIDRASFIDFIILLCQAY